MLLLLAALSVIAVGGDLGSGWVVALVLISAGGLLTAAILEPERIGKSFSPIIAVLAALALLGLVSLIWSSAPTSEDALATALLPAGYGAVALAVAVFGGRRESMNLISVWIVVLAALASLTGLIGVATESPGWATEIGGRWRAGGFLEYPPALAFLTVAAIPPLVVAIKSGRSALRVPALAAAGVCAVALILTGSRFGIGAGLLVLATSLLTRAPRPRRQERKERRARLKRPPYWFVVLLGAAVVSVLAVGALLERPSDVRQGNSGLDHGRIGLWADSLPAVADSPVVGHGSGSYFVATGDDQKDPTLFAHNLIVENTVELGIGGGILVVLLFAATGNALYLRLDSRQAWLFGPGVIAFLGFCLVDWQWHLAGVGAIWAVMLGALTAVENNSAD